MENKKEKTQLIITDEITGKVLFKYTPDICLELYTYNNEKLGNLLLHSHTALSEVNGIVVENWITPPYQGVGTLKIVRNAQGKIIKEIRRDMKGKLLTWESRVKRYTLVIHLPEGIKIKKLKNRLELYSDNDKKQDILLTQMREALRKVDGILRKIPQNKSNTLTLRLPKGLNARRSRFKKSVFDKYGKKCEAKLKESLEEIENQKLRNKI